MSMTQGWQAPTDYFKLQQEFFAKNGDDHYTREIDRRWRKLGKMIEKGARIRDGYLGR